MVPEKPNLLHRISKALPDLSPAMQQIANEILGDPKKAQSLSITELASAAGVADSSVSRFMKELEIDGYNNLRLGIAEAVFGTEPKSFSNEQSFVYEGILKGDSTSVVLEKTLMGSTEALTRTVASLNPETLQTIVNLLGKTKNIYFVAMGSSAIAAENAIMRFVRAGKRCLIFRDQSIQIMAAATLEKGDLLIAISDSGSSTPVVDSLKVGKIHGAVTVLITSDPTSPAAKAADHVLLTSPPIASSPVYGETVTAKWGQLLAIDVLYANYAAKYFDQTTEFLQESYLSGIKGTRQ